ncbi:hypothetical protein ACFL1J_02250 [Pseudomonadota bacterium]
MDTRNPAPVKSHEADTPVSRVRLVTGGALFIGGFMSPLLIPFVTQSDLPAKWKAVLSTGLVAGLPEIGMVLAVAVLGKQGFALLKGELFALLRKHTEPSAITARRYRLGLVLFCIPLLVGWLTPYLVRVLPVLSQDQGSLLPVILLDLMFAGSFLVLGEEFWEKVRRLFIYEAGPVRRQDGPPGDPG